MLLRNLLRILAAALQTLSTEITTMKKNVRPHHHQPSAAVTMVIVKNTSHNSVGYTWPNRLYPEQV